MRKFLSLFIVSTLFLIPTSCEFQDNPAAVAGDIVQSFGNSCSSHGKWSQTAQSQTDSLIKIFQKLKDSDKCKGMGTFLESLHNTASSIHSSYTNDSYLEYRQLQEEIQEMTIALQSATDPELIQTLSAQILSHQVSLSGARAQKQIHDVSNNKVGYQDQYSKTTQALGSQFSNLFSQTGDLSSCLQQSPSSVITLFSGLAGAAGSFASPVLGSKMQVLSNMLNTFLGYLRNAKIEKKIWALYEVQMTQALTCGLESMTNFYCQAEDASKIVMSQANSYDNPGDPPHDFWKGIDLVTRRLPVLNNWLSKVKGGVTPQNPNDAQRMKNVREKKLMLETKSLDVQGVINEAIRKISQSTDNQTKRDIKISTLVEVASLLKGGRTNPDPNDPFNSFKATNIYACWLVKGANYICPNIDRSTETLQSYIEKLNPTLNLEEVLNNTWPQILERVERIVNLEFNDIIFINPDLLLAEAQENKARQISPREVIVRLKSFTQELFNSSKDDKPHRKKVLLRFIELLEKSLQVIDSSYDFDFFVMKGPDQGPCNPKDPECDDPVPLNPLIEIYELFRLEYGTQFSGEQVVTFVNWDLLDRLNNDELPDDIEKIIREANGEILHRLTAAGFQDLYSVKRDLDSAKMMTKANFTVFRDFMSENKQLEKIVLKLKANSDKYETESDGPYRVYGQALGHLCTLIFASGESWPSKKTHKACYNATLYGVYPDPNHEYKISVKNLSKMVNETEGGSLEKLKARTCVYHKFLRGQKLYEVMKKDSSFFGIQKSNQGHLPMKRFLDLVY